MTYDTIDLTVQNGLARITLARPSAGNSIDKHSAHELMKVAVTCRTDPGVRCVLLSAQGASFCVGGGLRAFADEGVDGVAAMVHEAASYLHTAVSHFAHMRAPLVVAVNGVAAGGGMSLAIQGDIVFMAKSASFCTAYTAAGLSPDGGMTYTLPRLVGLRRAQELLLTNRRVNADEALATGLVTHVVDDTELLAQAISTAQTLASGPTKAFGLIRSHLRACYASSLEAQLEQEALGLAMSASSLDGQEGIHAFLKKTRPSFVGA